MFEDKPIEVSVSYGDTITFFLKVIGIADERELRAKAFGKTDEESAKKEYQTNVDVLAELSVKCPDGIFADGAIPKSIPAEIVKDFFAEKSAIKERIAYFAVQGYFTRLMPSESFF